jgi:YesN/AraC family two-component response regulator
MARQGLSQICQAEPDIEVIGQAADGQEACRLAVPLQPDVVIMDINMPVLDGVQAICSLTQDLLIGELT